MRVTRTLTYQSDDEERLVAVLQRSLGLGVHKFGPLMISIGHQEGPNVEGIYLDAPRKILNYEEPLDLIGRLKFQALTHPPTADCPDVECLVCGVRDCPHGEPMHHHHDGCPACYVREPDDTADDPTYQPLRKETGDAKDEEDHTVYDPDAAVQ